MSKCRLIFGGTLILWCGALLLTLIQPGLYWPLSGLPALATFALTIRLTEPHLIRYILARSISRLSYLISLLCICLSPLFLIIAEHILLFDTHKSVLLHLSDYILFSSITISLLLWQQPVLALISISLPLLAGLFPQELLSRLVGMYHFVLSYSSNKDIISITHLYNNTLLSSLLLLISSVLFMHRDLP